MRTQFETFRNAAKTVPIAAAVVFGSGLQTSTDRMDTILRLGFEDVPDLAATSVAGHCGRVTLADWAGKRVLLFEGRLHYYEGHCWTRVTRPIQIAHQLGAPVLLATNAAGGIHPRLGPGCLMAVRDHILWNVPRPWLHPSPGALGLPRGSPYSARLLQVLADASHATSLELHFGVYASLTGPCYETPAEIRALKTWGAAAVGMSTAREVETAVALGIECAAVSCITNKAAGLGDGRLDHQEVLANAGAQSHRVAELIEGFLRLL